MKKRAVLLLALAAAGLFLACLGWNRALNRWVVVTQYEVKDPRIPEGMDGARLMVIADLHNAPYPAQICARIWECEPDWILLAGDMVQLPYDNPDTDMENVWSLLDQVADVIPTYFVSGNHDAGTGTYYKIYQALKDHGAVSLENKADRLWKGDASVQIIGLQDPGEECISSAKQQEMLDTAARLTADDPDSYTILLCHRSNAYAFLKEADADLMIAGHMHGGVVRLPLLGGVIGNDDQPLFPRYDYGLFRESGMTLIVSGGCDCNPLKQRFNNPPELVLITLRHGPAQAA